MIHRISLPTPFGPGSAAVNAWLVDDDPLTLVDAGCSSATGLLLLEAQLAAHGRRVEDLERIVITHQHSDHTGLLAHLVARAQPEVVALSCTRRWLEDFEVEAIRDHEHLQRELRRHGTPRWLRLATERRLLLQGALGSGCPVDRSLRSGDRIEFAGRTWTALHRPGHSPCDTVFFDADRAQLVTGDHLLAEVAPNLYIARSGTAEPFRPVAAFRASLEATRQLGAREALPGHGPPIRDVDALIARRIRSSAAQLDRLERLVDRTPHTAFEIAERCWGSRVYDDVALVLSHAVGHLDVLADHGRVAQDLDQRGTVRFFVP